MREQGGQVGEGIERKSNERYLDAGGVMGLGKKPGVGEIPRNPEG